MTPDLPPLKETCPDCAIQLEYDRLTARPGGSAIVYACPRCGREAVFTDDDPQR